MNNESKAARALVRLASQPRLEAKDYEQLAMAVFGGLLAQDAARAQARFKDARAGGLAFFVYGAQRPTTPVNFVDPCWSRLSQDLYAGERAAFVGVQSALAYAKAKGISAHPRWGGERKRVVERLFFEKRIDPYAPIGMRVDPAKVAPRTDPPGAYVAPDVLGSTMRALPIHEQLGIADAWIGSTVAERVAINAELATLGQPQRVLRLKALAGDLLYTRIRNRDIPDVGAEWLRDFPRRVAAAVDKLPPRARALLGARYEMTGTRGDVHRLHTEINNRIIMSEDRVSTEELLDLLIRHACPSRDPEGAVCGYEIKLEQGTMSFAAYVQLRERHAPKLAAMKKLLDDRHERERVAEHRARPSDARADHKMTESHDRLYKQAYLDDPRVVAAVRQSGGTLQKHSGGEPYLVYDEYYIIIDRMPPGVTPEAFLIEFATHLNRTVNNAGFSGVNVFKRRSPHGLHVGEIVDIDMFGPDNGTVILTKLTSSYFIYTVLNNDTYGGEHPEYGSREFGFERQHDGSIKLYTRAVSSPANMAAGTVGALFQEGGWTFMLKGMGNTITRRGGSVVPGSFHTTKWKVDK